MKFKKVVVVSVVFLFVVSSFPLYGADWGVKDGIVINIPQLQLYLFSEGHVVKQYPIAVGKKRTQTPVGKFKILQMAKNPAWKSPWTGKVTPPGLSNPLGTRWIRFFDGYGIHGNNDSKSIGTFASHGCVRMHNRDVEELYNNVHIGMPVHVIYETILEDEKDKTIPCLAIYPDHYEYGTNTLSSLMEKALPLGLGYLSEADFQNAINQSQQMSVILEQKDPVLTIVLVNDIKLSEKGYLKGNEWLLPLRSVIQLLEETIEWSEEKGIAFINGKEVTEGVLINEKTYIPARYLSEYCGGNAIMDWEKLSVWYERMNITLNGNELAIPCYINKGEPMIQLRPLVEKIGVLIEWNQEEGCAMIGEKIVNGIIRDDRTYVNRGELEALLEATTIWNQSTGCLEIEVPWYHEEAQSTMPVDTTNNIDTQPVNQSEQENDFMDEEETKDKEKTKGNEAFNIEIQNQ